MKIKKSKKTVMYNIGKLPDEIVVKQCTPRLKSLQGGVSLEEKDVVYVKKTNN